MSCLRFALAAALAFGLAAPASAQAVKLEFRDGRVTLRAQNAPVRIILAEWARLGGTKIINGERVAGAPVTIELTGVPERQALDILLRSVSGYLVAARQTPGSGASAFDRILIVPTSTAPPRAAAASPATFAPPPPPPRPRPEPADNDLADPDAELPDPPRPPARPMPVVGPGRPVNVPADRAGAEGVPPVVHEDSAAPAPVPNNPFGVTAGSARPGAATPAPAQDPNRQQR